MIEQIAPHFENEDGSKEKALEIERYVNETVESVLKKHERDLAFGSPLYIALILHIESNKLSTFTQARISDYAEAMRKPPADRSDADYSTIQRHEGVIRKGDEINQMRMKLLLEKRGYLYAEELVLEIYSEIMGIMVDSGRWQASEYLRRFADGLINEAIWSRLSQRDKLSQDQTQAG